MTPRSFVLFGYNHFTCDIAEVIQESGDWVVAIVLNREDRVLPGKPTLADWVGRQKQLGQAAGLPGIATLAETEFQPRAGHHYAMGFAGAGQAPWVEALRKRHSLEFSTLTHPSAVVSRSAVVGQGCVVCAGAIVAAEATLGEHVTLNRGCTVGHHASLGDYSVVQPGANVASFVRVGRGAMVGLGASVLQDRTIGEFAQVAAGAIVTGDVPERTLVAGVPAVFKRKLVDLPSP
jgi:sugar O-acyltransferase (sialic acid O-acetyltransferase NeuD family)